jgi:hypothetical protein
MNAPTKMTAKQLSGYESAKDMTDGNSFVN